ncbi:MAG: hypothetical protein JO254_16820 [Pseudolabrys sp.]|nr:hypothetical protein [Pseudolabrys sp.]
MNAPAEQRNGPIDAARLAQANINPSTGLATDYLNRFNEAIMLLEMLSACPDCIEDVLAWKPATYRQHFADSQFKDRALAIEAYDAADPAVRHCIDTLAETMTAVLEATRTALRGNLPADVATQLAEKSAASLRPLVAHAGAIINGETVADDIADAVPQSTVDQLMKR